ncbi:hypothetical protein ACU4GD_18340 [Cupriavidus basilensis]
MPKPLGDGHAALGLPVRRHRDGAALNWRAKPGGARLHVQDAGVKALVLRAGKRRCGAGQPAGAGRRPALRWTARLAARCPSLRCWTALRCMAARWPKRAMSR